MTFTEKHITKIIVGLGLAFLLIFIQNCGTSRKLSKLEKQDKLINTRLDSIPTKVEMQKSITIEGLKSEKRMIQATDRKIFDVNRQSAIDEELKKLESYK